MRRRWTRTCAGPGQGRMRPCRPCRSAGPAKSAWRACRVARSHSAQHQPTRDVGHRPRDARGTIGGQERRTSRPTASWASGSAPPSRRSAVPRCAASGRPRPRPVSLRRQRLGEPATIPPRVRRGPTGRQVARPRLGRRHRRAGDARPGIAPAPETLCRCTITPDPSMRRAAARAMIKFAAKVDHRAQHDVGGHLDQRRPAGPRAGSVQRHVHLPRWRARTEFVHGALASASRTARPTCPPPVPPPRPRRLARASDEEHPRPLARERTRHAAADSACAAIDDRVPARQQPA